MPKGFVETATPYVIRGWAVDDDLTRPARVRIELDGITAAVVRCGSYRADLDEAGLRDGFAEFRYAVPEEYRDGNEHVLVVRHESNDCEIWSGRIAFNPRLESDWSYDAKSDGQHCITHRASSRESLVNSVKDTRKLAILATFRVSATLLKYQRALTVDLIRSGFSVVYVDVPVSQHFPKDYEWAAKEVHFIRRLNYGYDFGSWSAGLGEAIDAIEHADEILLVNDSCFLVKPTRYFFQKMRRTNGDIVGICDSFERTHHIQSQLILFRGEAIKSDFVLRFFDEYKPSSDKGYTVEHGELGLSNKARQCGIRIASVASYNELAQMWLSRGPEYLQRAQMAFGGNDSSVLRNRFAQVSDAIFSGQPLNPSHFFWDLLLTEFGCPLLKKEFVSLNPCNVPTSFLLSEVLSDVNDELLAAMREARSFTPGVKAHALSTYSHKHGGFKSGSLTSACLRMLRSAIYRNPDSPRPK